LVIVKAFNIYGELNKPYLGVKSCYAVPKVNFPTRIVEFEFKKDSSTTLNMILDRGWEISFRIHNASTMVERSLKFDIQLLGNPPILFTQYIFQ
ncbi:MAG: HaeIII family restriction endonuclease, partial [Muribaculaceae bacterium]|nr:HaeIII family restriction endonuclease [Muribaculaceae bacterium]